VTNGVLNKSLFSQNLPKSVHTCGCCTDARHDENDKKFEELNHSHKMGFQQQSTKHCVKSIVVLLMLISDIWCRHVTGAAQALVQQFGLAGSISDWKT